MKTRWMAWLLVLGLIACGANAHGDKVHVLGTIEKINGDVLSIKTGAGKSVDVKLAASTTYQTSDGKPGKQSDLAVGQRVAIHATAQHDKSLEAATVKFSVAGAAPAKASAPAKSKK